MGVPKSRDRTSPIGPILKLLPFLCGDRFPIGDKPWTGCAVDDAIVEEGQRTHSRAV